MSAANAAQGFGANATILARTQSIRESHTLTHTDRLILALQCTYTLACSAMIMSI